MPDDLDRTPNAPASDPAWGKGTRNADEERFLAGPRTRRFELLRAAKIFAECIYGFRRLHRVGPAVTVFGSARLDEASPYYAMARSVGSRLARLGLTVMTGGGPGIMEAANRGAKEAGGTSSSPAALVRSTRCSRRRRSSKPGRSGTSR